MVLGYIAERAQNKAFGPEQRAKFAHKYRKSFGLDGGLGCDKAIKAYESGGLTGFASFGEVKIQPPNKEEDNDKKKQPPPVPIIEKPILDKIISQVPDIDKALQEKFKALREKKANAIEEISNEIKELNDRLLKITNPSHAPLIASRLQDLRSKIKKIIEEEQTEEKAMLKDFLEDPAVANPLKQSLDNDKDAFDQFKEKMEKALEESHKVESGKLDKSLGDEVNKLHKANEKEWRRISYLAAMYETSPEMKRFIDAWYLENYSKVHKNGADLQPSNISLDADTGLATLKGLKVTDLKYLETITGRQINHAKNKDGKDVFSVQFPRMGPFYYRGAVDSDLLSLAQSFRAAGHDKITLSITYRSKSSDPDDIKYALKLGRKAYKAALRAGFDEKNIVIKLNDGNGNQETTINKIDDLFKKNPTRKKVIEEDVKKENETFKEKEEYYAKKDSGKDLNHLDWKKFKEKAQEESKKPTETSYDQYDPIVEDSGTGAPVVRT